MVKAVSFLLRKIERRDMKRLVLFMLVTVILCFLESVPVRAEGDPNIDGGGSNLGEGTAQNKWEPNDEGIRATIIDAVSGQAVSSSVDISNVNTSDIVGYFGKVSKAGYRNGEQINLQAGSYSSYKPTVPLPKIINTVDQPARIEDIKAYFTDEQVLRAIAGYVGFDFETMIGGGYKLMIEPIAYVTFQGVRVAFTATEAALYDSLLGGLVKRKMNSLSHKNLPLSLFLERDEAGFASWTGSRTNAVSDADIITYLGLGVVRFTDDETTDTPPVSYLEAPDYVYRTDTHVITCVTVGGSTQSDPDHPVSVTFSILGRDYTVGNIYYPADGSQNAWVCWRTPSTPQRVEITVTSSANVSKRRIIADIVSLDENPPPNPVADDVNWGWDRSLAQPRLQTERTSAYWTAWRPQWHQNLVWHSDWKWHATGHTAACARGCRINHGYWHDDGWYVDEGWWDFYLDSYHAWITGSASLVPDDNCPTASGDVMKSGYGVNLEVRAKINVSSGAAVTGIQTAVSYFPEFYYRDYWRHLDLSYVSGESRFTFKVNPYSTLGGKTHFTPIWMPDGWYSVHTYVMDAWTPGGMLSMNVSDGVTISGNLWDDWHVAPDNP